jgi:hypothetical protein
VITFRTTVPANINSVENQALAFWDHNDDGIIETDEHVNTDDPVTSPMSDTTKVSKPCRLHVTQAVQQAVLQKYHQLLE